MPSGERSACGVYVHCVLPVYGTGAASLQLSCHQNGNQLPPAVCTTCRTSQTACRTACANQVPHSCTPCLFSSMMGTHTLTFSPRWEKHTPLFLMMGNAHPPHLAQDRQLEASQQQLRARGCSGHIRQVDADMQGSQVFKDLKLLLKIREVHHALHPAAAGAQQEVKVSYARSTAQHSDRSKKVTRQAVCCHCCVCVCRMSWHAHLHTHTAAPAACIHNTPHNTHT